MNRKRVIPYLKHIIVLLLIRILACVYYRRMIKTEEVSSGLFIKILNG